LAERLENTYEVATWIEGMYCNPNLDWYNELFLYYSYVEKGMSEFKFVLGFPRRVGAGHCGGEEIDISGSKKKRKQKRRRSLGCSSVCQLVRRRAATKSEPLSRSTLFVAL
jgi:hypothetical protein